MADNAPAELQAWIDKLQELGGLPEKMAPLAAEALKAEVTRTIAAGTGPDGTPWPLTKDGKRPLQGAAKALRASSQGSTAILALEGPEVLHHEGRARGGVKRPILPSRRLNKPAVRALQAVAAKLFGKVMGEDG